MSYERSYKIKEFATDFQSEVQRLKSQVDLFWEQEIACYRKIGLKNGMSILECGSGPGYVIEKILTDFPECRATSIEIDSNLIDILKETSIRKNFNVSQQSITDLGFKDESFDFVVTRLVLEHLPDPDGAIWEVNRVLKPGGKAVFIDNDFEMHLVTYPEIPELDSLYDAYCRSRINDGGNPKIGRQLPLLMSDCGFKDITFNIICAHNYLTGDDMFLRSEGAGIPAQLVKDGYLKPEVFDTLALKWHRVLNSKKHTIYRQLFVACGEKVLGAKREISRTIFNEVVSDKSDTGSDNIAFSYKTTEAILKYIVDLTISTINPENVEVNGQTKFNDLGLDSLMVVEIINTIESTWGIVLSLMDFLDGQKLSDVAVKIEKILNVALNKKSSPFPGDFGSDIDVEWEEGVI
jgi:ubiquinone/menaquinone biosynthesis C-methylase UbiE/acyl carrier protein